MKEKKLFFIYKESLKYKNIYNKFLVYLTVVLILTIAFVNFIQVIARYLKSPFFWTEEISRIMLMYLSFIGASIALNVHGHLSLDIILKKFKGKARRRLDFLINVLLLFFCIALIVYSIQMMKQTWYMLTPLGIPRGFMYLCLPIGGMLMVIEIIFRFLHNHFNILEEEEDEKNKEVDS